jgi:hypothetical protein
MGTCVHFSRSLPSNSWWQTMAGWQVLSRPSAAEGGGRRPAFTGPATQPYSATEVDGWQHRLSRVSQNRAAVQGKAAPTDAAGGFAHDGARAMMRRTEKGRAYGHRPCNEAGTNLTSCTGGQAKAHLN